VYSGREITEAHICPQEASFSEKLLQIYKTESVVSKQQIILIFKKARTSFVTKGIYSGIPLKNWKRIENTLMKIERLTESDTMCWNQKGRRRRRRQRRTRNENSRGRRSKIGQNKGLIF